MGATIALRNWVLGITFGLTAYQQLSLSVGLSRANPLETGVGLDEPGHASYERVAAGPGDWDLEVEPTWHVENVTKLEFPVAGGDWGEVTHWVLFAEDIPEPNLWVLLAYDELVDPIHIATGYEMWFKERQLSITLD